MAEYSQSQRLTLAADNQQSDDPSWQLATTMATAADERKGGNILLVYVEEVSYLTDYFILVTSYSKAQARAISQSIQEKVEQQYQRQPLRVEGKSEGIWILLDYGEAIVHILQPQQREYYNLEAFWGHAQHIPYSSVVPTGN
ncbi:ribosome silencing factor [Geitlerinema sp. PCC 9228]|jgi:ribosome-associated protein|uniref:ribosome silencing factor n=1 Tax=Geitlerinema sp. PCC 9228 TaxID=111611 RepID=UPI0008F9D6A3|nr:ribosome silencing factor [Geitlerinema sp. PCC 9228]